MKERYGTMPDKITNEGNRILLEWFDNFDSWSDYYTSNIDNWEYKIIQLLFEWHFDVFDLHSKNLCFYYDELN